MNQENNKQKLQPDEPRITPDMLAAAPTCTEPEIDENELALAKEQAAESGDIFILKLKKPVRYEGIQYSELRFEWDTLTGQDSLDIENELQLLGKAVIIPEFSGEYLIRMAARACTPRVGADFFASLPLSEYNKIRSAGRSFLLKSE